MSHSGWPLYKGQGPTSGYPEEGSDEFNPGLNTRPSEEQGAFNLLKKRGLSGYMASSQSPEEEEVALFPEADQADAGRHSVRTGERTAHWVKIMSPFMSPNAPFNTQIPQCY